MTIKAFHLKFGKSELSVEEVTIPPYVLLGGLLVAVTVTILSTVV